MDKFVSMRLFTRIVDFGSISRAADSLGIPPSTATRMIQVVEANLGGKLLHRTSRRLDSTTAGAAYYAKCVRILADVEEAERTVALESSLPRGVIRVSTTATFAQSILISALHNFLEKFPEVSVELRIAERNADMRREGVDVILQVGEGIDDTLVTKRIGSIDIGYFASPAYLQRFDEPKSKEELAHHRLLAQLQFQAEL